MKDETRFERESSLKRNVSCRLTLTRTDCNAMRCEGIVDPLFPSSAPPFKRNAQAKKRTKRPKKLTHFIFFMSSPCNTGPLCAAIVFPFKKVGKWGARSGEGVKLGSWKKKREDFLMS